VSLASVIFNGFKHNRFVDPVNEKVVLDIDVTFSENHERTAQISKNPIEDGSEITDHVTLDNTRLTISGMVSDSPLGFVFFTSTANSPVQAGKTGKASVGALLAGTVTRSTLTFDYLNELMDKRIPFSIINKFKIYEDMVIQSLTIPRDGSEGESLKFTAVLEQVNVVSSQTTAIDKQDAMDQQSSSDKNGGKKTTEAATATEAANVDSVITQLTGQGA